VPSFKCQGKVESEKVDCRKKTNDGKDCCVWSSSGSLCECEQRRCYDELHPGQVPHACLATEEASSQWLVLLSTLILLLTFLASVVWWVRRRRQRKQSEMFAPPEEQDSVAAVEETLAKDGHYHERLH